MPPRRTGRRTTTAARWKRSRVSARSQGRKRSRVSGGVVPGTLLTPLLSAAQATKPIQPANKGLERECSAT